MEMAEEDGHEVDARVECKAESTSTAVNQQDCLPLLTHAAMYTHAHAIVDSYFIEEDGASMVPLN